MDKLTHKFMQAVFIPMLVALLAVAATLPDTRAIDTQMDTLNIQIIEAQNTLQELKDQVNLECPTLRAMEH